MHFNFSFLNSVLLAAVVGCCCCNNSSVTKSNSIDTALASVPVKQDTTLPDAMPNGDTTGNYEEMYVTIADTGNDYYALDKKMYELSKITHLKIDTMNRYYNTKKNEIVLPENDEDEMYRGEYFPRRYASDFLSLEYLNFFADNASEKSIALVAGIYETKKSADSVLQIIKPYSPKAYSMKSRVFVGCMH